MFKGNDIEFEASSELAQTAFDELIIKKLNLSGITNKMQVLIFNVFL